MKTKENTNAKENINAVGSNSKSTAPNAVCWLDVILFEDNTIAVEIYYVDIVYEFKDEFNKHTFTTIKELDDFFKGEDVIYDCDKYIDYVKEKYKKPFKALLLDNVVVSQEMLDAKPYGIFVYKERLSKCFSQVCSLSTVMHIPLFICRQDGSLLIINWQNVFEDVKKYLEKMETKQL